MLLSPAAGSGFHLTDDHEIISIDSRLSGSGKVIAVAEEIIKSDITQVGRLRPMYYFSRVVEVKLMGRDFRIWSLFIGLLTVLTAYTLYWVGRIIGFSFAQSLVFSGLSLIGPQAVVWWTFGPAETGGVFFLALALLFCFLQVVMERRKRLIDAAFVTTVLLMSLFKESFVLLIPALAFSRVWFDRRLNQGSSWFSSIRRNTTVMIILLGIFLIEMITIIFFVGTKGIVYAGVDANSVSLAKWLVVIAQLIWQTYFLFIPALAFATFLFTRKRLPKDLMNEALTNLLFLGFWLLPQLALYAKSGISVRYLLPATIGISLFNMLFWKVLNNSDAETGVLRRTNRLNPIVNRTMSVVFVVVLATLSLNVYKASLVYGLEGQSLNSLLKDVERRADDRKVTLLVADPGRQFEWAISAETYLSKVVGIRSFYLLPLRMPGYSPFEQSLADSTINRQSFEKKDFSKILDKKLISTIILLPDLEDAFLTQSVEWFDPAAYTRKQYNKAPSVEVVGKALGVTGTSFIAYYKR